MSWIGLKLLGACKTLADIGAWLLEKPIRAVLVLFALHVAAHQLWIDPRLRAERDEALALAEQRTAERDLANDYHRQTKANYRAAQAAAARLEAARLARVKAQQEEITDEVTADFRGRLADARARAEQLRGELARAREHPAGEAGGVRLPAPGDAAAGVAGPPADRGLPAGAGELDWRLVATEQAIQLDELITWVERQAQVEVNPE